ncbi:MAG: EAL domain-containing protein [Methylococcaceae bacterium]|nr:EAL domain-containing protein [Methylococcaceae bacterium]
MSRIKLLLVEDDLTDQMSFKRFVKREQLPYDYTIAGSIAQAREILASDTGFELILLDHSLGDGTAFDLFEHIPVAIPIVFVTGSGDEEIAVKAIKQGASDYLTKDLEGAYLKLLPMTIENVIKTKMIEKELEAYRHQLEEMVEERTIELKREISERMQIEEQLIDEKERAQVTLKSIGDAVITTDIQGLIEFINPVAESLTGWRLEEAKGQHIDSVFHIIYEESKKKVVNPIARCLAKNKIVGLDEKVLLINRMGTEYSIQDSAAPIHDKDGIIQGVVLVFSDVTQARRLTKELAYHATHDPLTGLVNRRVFEQRLNRILKARNISGGQHIFCYLDLDQFRIINDSCGHTAGDELLKQVTSILHTKVRTRDTLARLGGDEFGILMEHCSLERGERLANILRESIADYRFQWDEKSFRIGVSIGLMQITEEFNTLNDLLITADASCYAAKDAGRNRVHVYQPNDADIKLRSGQVQWVVKLNKALDDYQFRLFKQEIKSFTDDEGDHYEILVRLEDEEKQLIPPDAFIPAAERYGLMPKVDQFIIDNAFAFFAENSNALDALSLCTLNLSGHTLGCEWLYGFITKTIDYYGLPPEKFCFEITETAAITNLNMVTAFIKQLKERGCLFALDDFGSGLSSFAYLKNLPVDFLKIDGMFVKDICEDPVDFAMVKSINEIGHLMGRKTIAEYVESECIYNKLNEMGVDFAQGYWISRPKPIHL